MLTRRIVGLVVLGALLAACGDVEVVAPTTIDDVNIEATTTTVAVEAVSTTIQSATTTTIESTTTTSVPVTTTTVLDVACIKTTTCQYANLVGVDFSRLKLDFIDFSVAGLAGASFVGANLTNSIFIRADLSAANFEGATLKNVDFTAAVLTAASFKGANLEGAVLCDVDLAGVLDLTKAQLDKVKKFKTKGKVYCP
ncbi:MAG: pentapeptide repeat-containing protein [Actinomycetota bacterium]